MTLGSCLIANDIPNLGDAIIQDRIDGLSWAEIADKHNLGSPQAARNAFKKLTGITDFKIKGKELKKVIDSGLVDDLKKATPKVPKKAKGTVADVNTSNVLGQSSGLGSAPNINPLYSLSEGKSYYGDLKVITKDKAFFKATNIKDEIGYGKYQFVVNELDKGTYYANIKGMVNVDIPVIDRIYFWRKVEDLDGDVWKAYKTKVTSHEGAQAVQDLVWDLRKKGMLDADIADVTGIDKSVVKLIVDGKWGPAAPGSSQYIGYGTSSSSAAAPAPGATKVGDLVGETANFKDLSEIEADQWANSLGIDLTPEAKRAYQSYTGSGYIDVNFALRGKNGYSLTPSVQAQANHISNGMSITPRDVRLHRGVDIDAFDNGIPSVGDAYTDKGFMSTSFGQKPAFSTKQFHLVLDVPAGARARPVHALSGLNEREILLDKGQKWVVTGIKRTGHYFNDGRYEIHMRMVIP